MQARQLLEDLEQLIPELKLEVREVLMVVLAVQQFHLGMDFQVLVILVMQVLVVQLSRIVRAAAGSPHEHDPAASTTRQVRELASQFKHLVVTHYLTSKSVGFYASQLNVTPAYLSKCVRATYGKSPKQVINDAILLHVKALLHDPKRSIKEIAYDLNFADYSHFVKFFKQASGLTPHEFRNQA